MSVWERGLPETPESKVLIWVVEPVVLLEMNGEEKEKGQAVLSGRVVGACFCRLVTFQMTGKFDPETWGCPTNSSSHGVHQKAHKQCRLNLLKCGL